MQIDDLIPPSSTSAYPVSQPDDPYVADLLQLADGRFVVFCIIERMHFLDGFTDCRLCVTHWDSVLHLYCRIHELQEDIIKVKLDLENAQEFIKHLNTQVGKKLPGSTLYCNVLNVFIVVMSFTF